MLPSTASPLSTTAQDVTDGPIDASENPVFSDKARAGTTAAASVQSCRADARVPQAAVQSSRADAPDEGHEGEDPDPTNKALLAPAMASVATLRVPIAPGSREELGIEHEATELKEDLAREA